MMVATMRVFIAVTLLLLSTVANSGAKDTISYIEKMLSKGKKVAILIIDMQSGYRAELVPSELKKVTGEEVEVLNHFASNPDVLFVDIHWEGKGQTIPELLASVQQKENWKHFVKREASAFLEASLDPASGPHAISGYLHDNLTSKHINDVVPMGCFSGDCILETTRGAVFKGFDVHIDHDLLVALKSGKLGELTAEEQYELVMEFWKDAKEELPGIQFINKRNTAKYCQP